MDVERVNYRRQHSGGRRTGADQVVLRQRRASEGSKIATDWRMSVNVEGQIVPPSTEEEPLVMHGNLHKLGRIFKTWKQRYFEIQGCNMYYYKNSKKPSCLGYIDLTQCYSVSSTRLASFGSPFELKTAHRLHILAARNETDMRKWVEAIKSKMGLHPLGGEEDGGQPDLKKRRATVKRTQTWRKPAAVQPPPSSSSNRLRPPARPQPPVQDYHSSTIGRTQQPHLANEQEAVLTGSHSYHGFDLSKMDEGTEQHQLATPASPGSPEHITLPLPELPPDSPVPAENTSSGPPPSLSPPPTQTRDDSLPPSDPVADSLPPPSVELASSSENATNVIVSQSTQESHPSSRPVSPVDEELPPAMPVSFDLPPLVNGELSVSPVDLELPLSPVDIELPLSPVDVELPLSPVDGELPPSPVDVELPLSPVDVELPLSPVDVELPLSPVDVELPLSPADVEVPLSPADVEVPLSPADVELPLSPVDVEVPLSGVNAELLPAPVNMNLSPESVSDLSPSSPADKSPSPVLTELPSADEALLPLSAPARISSPPLISPLGSGLPPLLEEEISCSAVPAADEQIPPSLPPAEITLPPPPSLEPAAHPEIMKKEDEVKENNQEVNVDRLVQASTVQHRETSPSAVGPVTNRSTSPQNLNSSRTPSPQDQIPPKLPPPPGDSAPAGRRRSIQSPPRAPPPPPNSAIAQLRELVQVEESWREGEESVDWMPSPEEAPWLLEPTAVEQLRHFLRICD